MFPMPARSAVLPPGSNRRKPEDIISRGIMIATKVIHGVVDHTADTSWRSKFFTLLPEDRWKGLVDHFGGLLPTKARTCLTAGSGDQRVQNGERVPRSETANNGAVQATDPWVERRKVQAVLQRVSDSLARIREARLGLKSADVCDKCSAGRTEATV